MHVQHELKKKMYVYFIIFLNLLSSKKKNII